jgi:Tfp pilus assembly PilM family ATPase
MPIDMENIPDSHEAGLEMVRWKLKKLLPGVTAELAVVFREMTPAGETRRVLVAAAPADTLRSIEDAFEANGVRPGAIAPFSLALFEGLSPLFASKTAGDYALIHRTSDSFVFLVARGAAPVFFRQRPADETDVEHGQEVRLSLSYYAEKLKGDGIAAVYAYDVRGAAALDEEAEGFAVPVQPLSGQLLDADATFDERVASRPELLPAFAAVYGRK